MSTNKNRKYDLAKDTPLVETGLSESPTQLGAKVVTAKAVEIYAFVGEQ